METLGNNKIGDIMKRVKREKQREKIGFIKLLERLILSILIISFGILIYCIYQSINAESISKSNNKYDAQTISINNDENETKEEEISNIVENVNHSVVGISKIKNKGNTVFLEDGNSSLGLGTGFVVSDNGYIITNQHVAGDSYSTCYVTLYNGKSYTGNVIWADETIDLSIIKINAGSLEYLTLGDSDKLKLAQEVYAIGNPIGFEFQRTVTYGIISGLNRTVKLKGEENTYYMEDLIQTDATINPGNSGGPLIDKNGKVIGINSVKITSAEGIGFAIPVNIIQPILTNIINVGSYKVATLGIFAYDKNVIPYINQELGLNLDLSNGIYVAQVVNNSAADQAGFLEGDIITSIDNINLNKMSDLRKYIYTKKTGDNVKITYSRKNKEYVINVILK